MTLGAGVAAESAPSAKRSAWSGLLAAIFALALSELLAGLVPGIPSLIGAVGDLVIERAPPALEDFAISVFGVYDKAALLAGIIVVSVLAGALIGIAAAHRFWVAVAGFGGFGIVGVAAAGADRGALAMVSAALSATGGLAVLSGLLRRASLPAADGGRRAFLRGAGGVTALAALSWGVGRVLVQRGTGATASRQEVLLPDPGQMLPPPSAAASLEVPGLAEIVTPNPEFYRIDTAFLAVPRVEIADWRLNVTGMVDRPYQISLEELLAMPMEEAWVTLACVSNVVGGDLVGNARWLGVPLAEVLDRAGVKDGATQIVGRSVDDFTVGFPTEAAFDGRRALVAVGMNGEPLPFEHGFPARLVVAGLYGYVSATKWLTEIELTTLEAFDAYWIPRGWAKEAPIKTQSRIDVPKDGAGLSAGRQAIAGVAWAPHRRIDRVEVQAGEGGWAEAQLSEPLSDDAWRQWLFEWEARPGTHAVRVRATDGAGETQTEERLPPRPDGATGYHTITVHVT